MKRSLPTLLYNLICYFVLRQQKIQRRSKRKPWAYPNFGRFYGYRLQKFIERIKNRNEYQEFVVKALKEDIKSFAEKFDLRIGVIANRGLGSGQWWEADVKWSEK